MDVAGRLGVGARLRLDSGQVLIISIATKTVRVYQLKRFLVIFLPRLIYETPTFDAYAKYTSTPRSDAVEVDTAEKRTGAFLGWIVGNVIDMPSVEIVVSMLPLLVGRNTHAPGA